MQQQHLNAAGVAAGRIDRHRAEIREDLLEVRMQVPEAKSRDVQEMVIAAGAAAIAVNRRARNTMKYGNATEIQRKYNGKYNGVRGLALTCRGSNFPCCSVQCEAESRGRSSRSSR